MARKLTGIITGDIVNSRNVQASAWMKPLKKTLGIWGGAPRSYEIFRGDSFQAEVKDPADTLRAAILIKATLKSIRSLDTRMAIGIGTKTYSAARITESNGTAFVHSGTQLDNLPRLRTKLAVSTGRDEFDREMNLCLRLALVIMDNWTVNSAAAVRVALLNPGKPQAALGKMLKIKQNAVSTRLKRAHFEEIALLIEHFRNKIRGWR